LGVHHVAAKSVSCLLSKDWKHNHVDVRKELAERANADENCLKNIITGDETWVYGYDIRTKAQSSQWA
jgi:PAB1-binding protein PBP1